MSIIFSSEFARSLVSFSLAFEQNILHERTEISQFFQHKLMLPWKSLTSAHLKTERKHILFFCLQLFFKQNFLSNSFTIWQLQRRFSNFHLNMKLFNPIYPPEALATCSYFSRFPSPLEENIKTAKFNFSEVTLFYATWKFSHFIPLLYIFYNVSYDNIFLHYFLILYNIYNYLSAMKFALMSKPIKKTNKLLKRSFPLKRTFLPFLMILSNSFSNK